MITSDDLKAYAIPKIQAAGLKIAICVCQIQEESGWQHYDAYGNVKQSYAGAIGVAQIVQKYHPDVDATDPYASLDWYVQYMVNLVNQYGGDYTLALAAYNAGGGNVARYGGVPPFPETQRYVNDILSCAAASAPPATPSPADGGAEVPSSSLLPWIALGVGGIIVLNILRR